MASFRSLGVLKLEFTLLSSSDFLSVMHRNAMQHAAKTYGFMPSLEHYIKLSFDPVNLASFFL